MLDQGRGSFAFTGDQADYGFDLKISGLDADKLDYIGNTDSDEDIGDDEAVQIEDVLEEIMLLFTDAQLTVTQDSHKQSGENDGTGKGK